MNTTADYQKNLASYYEVIVRASGKTLSVCLARNSRTSGSPFISTLEVSSMEDSMYRSSDLNGHLLATVARHRFGRVGAITRLP